MMFHPFDFLRSRLVTAGPENSSKRYLYAANQKEAVILPQPTDEFREAAPLS
jgi:hypothetical protein